MNHIKKVTFTVRLLLSVVCLLLTVSLTIGKTSFDTELNNWITHTLADGGSIKLPPDWVIVQKDYSVEKSVDEKYISYSQRLLNAKGTYNGIVCSIKISRLWKENSSQGVILETYPEIYIKDIAQKQLRRLLESGSCEEYLPLRFVDVGGNLLGRYSVSLNNGNSRLDSVAAYKDGFLLTVSAAYSKNEESFWSVSFDQILKTWIIGTFRDTTSASIAETYKVGGQWTDYNLDGGSRIWIPSTWKCIAKNLSSEEEVLPETDYMLCTQKLMNLRPNLYPSDTSTVQILRVFLKDSTTNKIDALGKADLEDCEDAFVEGVKEGLPNAALKSDKNKYVVGQRTVISRVYIVNYAYGEVIATTHSFVADGCFYMLLATYPKENDMLWKSTIRDILSKWEFSDNQRDESGPTSAENIKEPNALNASLYHNSQGYFSFTLPSGWIEIPKDVIKISFDLLNEQSAQPVTADYDAAFQKTSIDYFTYPYILVQIDKGGRWPANEIQKLQPDEWKEAMEKGLPEVENSLPNLIKNLNIGQTRYDKARHIIFTRMKSEVTGVGNVLALTAVILSDYGSVKMYCYSTENRFNSDLDSFNQIIDSFKYDVGHEYSRVTKDNYIPGKKDSGGGLLKTTLIVFVVGILATLIIIIIARRSEKAAKQPTFEYALDEEMVGNGMSKSSTVELESQKHAIGGTPSLQNISSEFSVLGRLEQCANCERVIGNLEHSCTFEGKTVCVQCYEKLK